jgi:hypothetical protein
MQAFLGYFALLVCFAAIVAGAWLAPRRSTEESSATGSEEPPIPRR